VSDQFSWQEYSQDSPSIVKSPTFSKPWEADTFAMLVALEKRGFFSWSEWGDVLGAEIKAATDEQDTGENYYAHVLAALEKILTQKNIISGKLLKQYKTGWDRVVTRTPHGEPLELTDDDLKSDEK